MNEMLTVALKGHAPLPTPLLQRYARRAASEGDTRLLRTILARHEIDDDLREELGPRPTPTQAIARMKEIDTVEYAVSLLARDRRLLVREAVAKREGLPADVRAELVRDLHPRVAVAAVSVDTDLLDADTRNHAVGMLSDVFRDRPKQPKRAEIINAAIPLRQELLDAGDADAHLLLAVGDKDLDASDVKRFYTQIVDRLDEVPERNRATAINRTLRSLCSAVTQNRDGALDAAKSVLEHPWLARVEKHHWGYLTKCVQIVELVGAWDVERVVALPVGKLDQLVALLPKQIVRGTAMATPAKGLFRNPNLTVDVAVKVASRTDGGVWVVRELAAAGHVEALLRLVEHSVKALTYAQHVARVTDTASATLRRADAATLRRAAAARLQWAAVREQLFETDGGANSQSNRRVHLRQLASLGWLRMMPWSTLQNNEFMNAELVTAVFHELTEHLDHLDGLDTFDTLAASFDGTFGELIDAVNALTDLEGAGPPATEAA